MTDGNNGRLVKQNVKRRSQSLRYQAVKVSLMNQVVKDGLRNQVKVSLRNQSVKDKLRDQVVKGNMVNESSTNIKRGREKEYGETVEKYLYLRMNIKDQRDKTNQGISITVKDRDIRDQRDNKNGKDHHQHHLG